MNTVTSSVEFLMVINPVFYKRKKFIRVEIYKKKREYSVIQKDKKHIQVSNFISSKSKNKQTVQYDQHSTFLDQSDCRYFVC